MDIRNVSYADVVRIVDFPSTAYTNVGSMAQPVTMRELSI